MGPGSIHSPSAVCTFGVHVCPYLLPQVFYRSSGFPSCILNKSVSKHFMEASLKLNAFALLGFAWFSAECDWFLKLNAFALLGFAWFLPGFPRQTGRQAGRQADKYMVSSLNIAFFRSLYRFFFFFFFITLELIVQDKIPKSQKCDT